MSTDKALKAAQQYHKDHWPSENERAIVDAYTAGHIEAIQDVSEASPSPAEGASLEQIKQQYAIDKGYSSWDDLFNWVAREGQLPSVVAQLMEGAMRDVAERYAAQQSQAKAIRHEVIQAAYYPKPMCRDCAGGNGVCEYDGRKCDPYEAALDVLRAWAKEQIENRSQAKASAITGKFWRSNNRGRFGYTVHFGRRGDKKPEILCYQDDREEAENLCKHLNSLFSSSQTSPVGEGNAELAKALRKVWPSIQHDVDNNEDPPESGNSYDAEFNRATEVLWKFMHSSSSHPKVSNNGWISVEEKFPADEEIVLVYLDEEDAVVESYHKSGGHFYGVHQRHNRLVNVTHWTYKLARPSIEANT